MSEKTIFRCAVYTRKSSEEGLDQDFNSLEAQREACEAYVNSQSREGWKIIPDVFNDGGFSGGNMQRPALSRLMDMVREGKVDVIVIYKIDRLTRSLTDFARLAETFDKHGVSFVSVTQQFNTTTSMGRLMLNVLLSFAQFEREITGERIRDKIAASKKKGMWMGGTIPMGYDVVDRQLVINEADALTIRRVFGLYLEEGDVPRLLERLDRENIRTAKRFSAKGNHNGDRPFTRGHLYKLLSNPIYIGRVPHRDKSHPGRHPSIVDKSVWDAVQKRLAENTQGPRSRRRRAVVHTHMLSDLLFSQAGNRFLPTHANKGARRYRYYVEDLPPHASSPDENPSARPIRLPAGEIEAATAAGLAGVLENKHQLLHVLGELQTDQISGALQSAGNLARRIHHGPTASARDIRRIIGKAVYESATLTLHLKTGELRIALGIPRAEQVSWPNNLVSTFEPELVAIRVPLSVRKRGEQMKLVIHGAEPRRVPDRSLVSAVARAHQWANQLIDGEVESMADLARSEGFSLGYVHQVLPLAFLAPSKVEKILAGDHPPELTAEKLIWSTDRSLRWRDKSKVPF